MKKPLLEMVFGRSYEDRMRRRLLRHCTTTLILVIMAAIFTFGLDPAYAFLADMMVLFMTVIHAMYGRLSLRIGRLEQ